MLLSARTQVYFCHDERFTVTSFSVRTQGCSEWEQSCFTAECQEGGGCWCAAVGAAEFCSAEEQMGETRQGRMNSGQKEGDSRA